MGYHDLHVSDLHVSDLHVFFFVFTWHVFVLCYVFLDPAIIVLDVTCTCDTPWTFL